MNVSVQSPEVALVREDGPWIDRPKLRTEDARLVTAAGCFVDDLSAAGCLHLEFLRSSCLRGRIEGIDVEAARAAPDAVAVFMHQDIGAHGAATVNKLSPNNRAPPFTIVAGAMVAAVGRQVFALLEPSRM